MAKGKIDTGSADADTTTAEQPSEFVLGGKPSAETGRKTFQDRIISIDQQNGIVLVETDRPEGSTLSLRISRRKRTEAVTGGQVWFYYNRRQEGEPLGEQYTIEFINE